MCPRLYSTSELFVVRGRRYKKGWVVYTYFVVDDNFFQIMPKNIDESPSNFGVENDKEV